MSIVVFLLYGFVNFRDWIAEKTRLVNSEWTSIIENRVQGYWSSNTKVWSQVSTYSDLVFCFGSKSASSSSRKSTEFLPRYSMYYLYLELFLWHTYAVSWITFLQMLPYLCPTNARHSLYNYFQPSYVINWLWRCSIMRLLALANDISLYWKSITYSIAGHRIRYRHSYKIDWRNRYFSVCLGYLDFRNIERIE